jgi:hypothetical protein
VSSTNTKLIQVAALLKESFHRLGMVGYTPINPPTEKLRRENSKLDQLGQDSKTIASKNKNILSL